MHKQHRIIISHCLAKHHPCLNLPFRPTLFRRQFHCSNKELDRW